MPTSQAMFPLYECPSVLTSMIYHRPLTVLPTHIVASHTATYRLTQRYPLFSSCYDKLVSHNHRLAPLSSISKVQILSFPEDLCQTICHIKPELRLRALLCLTGLPPCLLASKPIFSGLHWVTPTTAGNRIQPSIAPLTIPTFPSPKRQIAESLIGE